MVKQLPDSPAQRAQNAGGVIGHLVAKGSATSHASANTVSLITHGAKDENGNAYPAANLMAFACATTNEAFIYQNAAPTATQLDFRTAGTAVPFDWFLFVVN